MPSSAQLAAAPGTGKPGTARVPVLMYHVIAAPPPGAPFPGLYVTPELFAAQMHALQAAGWHGVTLDQMEAYWKRGVPLPSGKPIVVSFDNGYQSQYTKAFPVLRAMGWAAVENLQLTGLPPSQGGFVAGQVAGLVAAGWELDTQGFSHADLIRLSPAALHYQVAVSRTVIQQRYGVPVNWFCYPSGHYDAIRRRRGPGGRVPRVDDCRPRLGRAVCRPLPAGSTTRARRDAARLAARSDRRDPGRRAAAGLLRQPRRLVSAGGRVFTRDIGRSGGWSSAGNRNAVSQTYVQGRDRGCARR